MKYLQLFETYKSQKEIEELTSSIVKEITKETINWHNDNIWTEPKDSDYKDMIGKSYQVKFKKNPGGFINGYNYVIDSYDSNNITFKGYNYVFDINNLELSWSDVNKFKFDYISSTILSKSVNINDFKELYNFIRDTEITIIPTIGIYNNIYGTLNYSQDSNDMDIYLYFDKSLYLKLRENKKSNIENNNVYNVTSLYIDLFYEFYDVLLHELQHAYDAYRSSGKSFNVQNKGNYRDREIKSDIIKNSKEKLKEEDIEFLNSVGKEYLNFPHEINARFTQAIRKTSFSHIELSDLPESDNYYSIMNKWEDVYSDFKSKFVGWRHLSDDYKRRLTRKLSQFYQLDMDRIKEENKGTIIKESVGLIAYHVTNKKNLPSILKNGLEPRVPEDFGENGDIKGIYLFKTIDDVKNALMNWLGERIEEWEEENDEVYEEVLLYVDISGISCLDTVEFEWTCTENIPAIRIISVDYEP